MGKKNMKGTTPPPDTKTIIEHLCKMDESIHYEFKRVSNKMVHKALETITAFANTEGGVLVLGMEDYKKSHENDRLYGIQENPEAVDELRRLIDQRITPSLEPPTWLKLPCILRDGTPGEVVVIIVEKSAKVHSLKVSKLLKKWVDADMLTLDMSKGKRGARYLKKLSGLTQPSLFLLSERSE